MEILEKLDQESVTFNKVTKIHNEKKCVLLIYRFFASNICIFVVVSKDLGYLTETKIIRREKIY